MVEFPLGGLASGAGVRGGLTSVGILDVTSFLHVDVTSGSRDDQKDWSFTDWDESERVTEVVGLLRVWIRIKHICKTTK